MTYRLARIVFSAYVVFGASLLDQPTMVTYNEECMCMGRGNTKK